MENLNQAHREAIREILEANSDLAERLASTLVSISHDPEDDTLYFNIGDPQEAIAESVRNSLYFRIDPDTLKIVSIEIRHASRRLMDEPELGKFVSWAFALMTGGRTVRGAEFADALRELATA